MDIELRPLRLAEILDRIFQLYRARFAGLDSASAEAACRSLKRTGFSCFTAHDD